MALARGGAEGVGRDESGALADTLADGSAQGLQIIRPFLEISKAEILEYLRIVGNLSIASIRPIATPSFCAIGFAWNCCRSCVIGSMAGLAQGWREQAAMLRDEQAVLDQVADSELAKCRRGDGLDRIGAYA